MKPDDYDVDEAIHRLILEINQLIVENLKLQLDINELKRLYELGD